MTEEMGRYLRPDGKQIVTLVRLENGFYSFTEENEHWEEPHPAIGDGYAYWITSDGGSLYDSRETAERELQSRFPWIANLSG